jgi:hypothetical protein
MLVIDGERARPWVCSGVVPPALRIAGNENETLTSSALAVLLRSGIRVLILFNGGWRHEVLAELLVFDKSRISTLADFAPAPQLPPGAAGGGDKDDCDPFRPPKHLERLIHLGENGNFSGDRSKVVFKRVAPETRAGHPSGVRR